MTLKTTRIRVIEIAYQQFLEHGYKQTTTKQVAELAGVNESTLFRLFDTKQNLFHDAIAHYTSDLLQIGMESLTYGPSVEENFFVMLKRLLELFCETVPAFRLLIKTSLVDKRFLEQVRFKFESLKHLFKQYLDGMQRRGLIEKTDFAALTDYVLGGLFYEAFRVKMAQEDGETLPEELLDASCRRYAAFLTERLICAAPAAEEGG